LESSISEISNSSFSVYEKGGGGGFRLEFRGATFEAYRHTGKHIKYACFDQGGKFMLKEIIEHQDSKGMKWELVVHDLQLQNSVSERGMCTQAEQAQALLISSGLLRYLWEEAMRHSSWLQDCILTCALQGKTPYEVENGRKPHLAGIQEFGAAAYVKDMAAGKLDSHSQTGQFVGYDLESKGYWIYWPGKRKKYWLNGTFSSMKRMY
jgi:hypothetical protein